MIHAIYAGMMEPIQIILEETAEDNSQQQLTACYQHFKNECGEKHICITDAYPDSEKTEMVHNLIMGVNKHFIPRFAAKVAFVLNYFAQFISFKDWIEAGVDLWEQNSLRILEAENIWHGFNEINNNILEFLKKWIALTKKYK